MNVVVLADFVYLPPLTLSAYCSYCFSILNCLQYVHKNINNIAEYKAPECSNVSYSLMMVK
jgi:hypothetical protein